MVSIEEKMRKESGMFSVKLKVEFVIKNYVDGSHMGQGKKWEMPMKNVPFLAQI